MNLLKLFALGAIASSLAGCVGVPLADHTPSMEAMQLLRGGGYAPMHSGTFAPAPGADEKMDRSLGCRAANVSSPDDGSFAHYLGKTLESDLRAAGKLAAGSTLVVDGLLTRSDIDCGIGTGSATLAAHFTLKRGAQTVYDKELSVHATWHSEFIGAVAIPAAINEYSALYNKLVVTLLSDPDFKAAAKAS